MNTTHATIDTIDSMDTSQTTSTRAVPVRGDLPGEDRSALARAGSLVVSSLLVVALTQSALPHPEGGRIAEMLDGLGLNFFQSQESGPPVVSTSAGIPAIDAGRVDSDAPDAPESALAIALPKESIRYLTIDNTGAVWFRFAESRDAKTTVATIDPRGARTDYVDLRAAVEARYDVLRRGPSLVDFWAVDREERVWVGPAFYDGRQWTDLAPRGDGPSGDGPSGATAYDARVLVDRDDTAWVPYRLQGECQSSIACEQHGLMGFQPTGGVTGSVTVDTPPELTAHNLDVVQLAPGLAGAASAPRALYLFPGPAPVLHALTVNPGEVATGYATAVTAAPDGSPEVFLAIERVPRGAVNIVHAIAALRWSGTDWRETDLSGSPLFQGERARTAVVVAAAYGPAGELWLASSDGAMAERRGGRWLHFNNRNSPLGAPIRDIDVGPDGKLWVGTVDGTRTYLNGEWESSSDFKNPGLYVPLAVLRWAIR